MNEEIQHDFKKLLENQTLIELLAERAKLVDHVVQVNKSLLTLLSQQADALQNYGRTYVTTTIPGPEAT